MQRLSPMEELLNSLQGVLFAVWELFVNLLTVVLPWTPLVAWVAFWLFAVNWVKLRQILVANFGWIGVVLIALVAILVWGVVAPPADGYHYLFGLTLSNFVGKTVYVAALICIALLCGTVQLTGCCEAWTRFPEESPADTHAHTTAH